MFTAKINKLNSHAQDDLRFCRVEGVVNHYQRLKDEEQLQAIYALRDAAVGAERIAIEAAIPILQNHMMLSSSVIMRHTTVVSQIVELSHDDIPGKYYFTGNGMAKAPDHERPWDAFWCANNFDLGWISPKLCHIQIYFRNTDAELFYKDFGFAYVTSNHGINSQSAKHNMIHDWGYRNEIFEYHYETEIFKKLRGNWDLSFLKQPLNTHYRLIKEAYDYRHLIAPSNYESNNTLLFDGQNVVVYPGKHPDATCAQYFDLSRVDPDARGITIYFFPGHEKTLYQEHGFAYIVGNAANNTPGGSRADLIKKFHNPIFSTYYGHLPGRTYDITYPKRWRLEMNQVEYDWAIEKARQDAKHKKHMAMVKGIVGIGLGVFASTVVPGLGSQLLTAILRGAACGSVSSIVQGGNIAKGTLQGALFAGLNHTLSSMSVLKDAKKLQDALRIGITAAISAEMNGENVFKSMLIAVGTDALVGQFMKSEGLTRQEALIRAFGISAVAGVLGGQNLGNALMAGAIGTIGALSQQVGGELGNNIQNTIIEENVVEKPKKRLMITEGNEDSKQNSNYEYIDPQPMDLKERMKDVNKFFGVQDCRDLTHTVEDILYNRVEPIIPLNSTERTLCAVAGYIDDTTFGRSDKYTDFICKDKNSNDYQLGEVVSQTSGFFTKSAIKMTGNLIQEAVGNIIYEHFEERSNVKNK